MKELTITQEYLICAAKGKGLLLFKDKRKVACLVASGILELQLEGCINIEKKKITVCAELPGKLAYLEPLYHVLNQPKAVKVNKVVEKYAVAFTNKKLNELLKSIAEALKEKGIVASKKTGFLWLKRNYVAKEECVKNVIEKVRAELLEDGAVSEEAVALTTLLDKAECLKDYFSKFEQKEVRNRLAEIKKSGAGGTVQMVLDYLDTLDFFLMGMMLPV